MSKTIRLEVPDWQAGDNPVYQLGAQILSVIAPINEHQETIKIKIPHSNQPLTKENGVTAQSTILKTIQRTKAAITQANPDKIITFGGNCLVSQQPINYLNRHYNHQLGVIWIDSHPDISNPAVFYNEHAMVLGNLLHRGDPVIQAEVEMPLQGSQIYYAGIQEPTSDEQKLISEAGIEYQVQSSSELNLSKIQAWIDQNKFGHIYIHLDMDVLNPDPRNFYATYFNNPELGDVPDNAATGQMTRQSVWNAVETLSHNYDLVGLTLAE